MKKAFAPIKLLLILVMISIAVAGGVLFLISRIENPKKITEEKTSNQFSNKLQISKSFSPENNSFYYRVVGRFSEPISSDEDSGMTISKFTIEGDAKQSQFPVILPGRYGSINYGVQDPSTMAVDFSFREIDSISKDIKNGDLVELEITTSDQNYIKLLDSLIETNSTKTLFVLNPSRIVKLKQ